MGGRGWRLGATEKTRSRKMLTVKYADHLLVHKLLARVTGVDLR